METSKPHKKFASETEHAGRRMVLVGQWQDLAAYYRADDGTAWSFSACTGGWSNCGDYSEFVARFTQGRYRGELFPSWILSTEIRGVKMFAASDIDWKSEIDEHTLRFPTAQSAEHFVSSNASIFWRRSSNGICVNGGI